MSEVRMSLTWQFSLSTLSWFLGMRSIQRCIPVHSSAYFWNVCLYFTIWKVNSISSGSNKKSRKAPLRQSTPVAKELNSRSNASDLAPLGSAPSVNFSSVTELFSILPISDSLVSVEDILRRIETHRVWNRRRVLLYIRCGDIAA